MRKNFILIVLTLVLLLFVTGCSNPLNPFNKTTKTPQEPPKEEKKSDVAVTTTPQSAQPLSINILDKSYNQNLKITGKVDSGYKMFINEKEAVVDFDGNFNTDVTLTPGNNLFTFRAVSSDNKSIFITSKNVEYDPKPKLEITQLGQATGDSLSVEGITDPNSIVDVNGNKTQADKNGNFKITFTSDGTKTVRIVATNKAEKSTFLQKTLN